MNNQPLKAGFIIAAIFLSACVTNFPRSSSDETSVEGGSVQESCPETWNQRLIATDQLLLRCRLRTNPHLSVRSVDAHSFVVQVRSGDSFGADSITPTPTLTGVLDHVAKSLATSRRQYQISVVGHSDNVGLPAARIRMSERRAEFVHRYLIDKGVNKKLIVSEGKGSSDPLVGNDTPEGRAVNRRVDIFIRELNPTPSQCVGALCPNPN